MTTEGLPTQEIVDGAYQALINVGAIGAFAAILLIFLCLLVSVVLYFGYRSINNGFSSINHTVDTASNNLRKTLIHINDKHREDRQELQARWDIERAEMKDMISGQYSKSNKLAEEYIKSNAEVKGTLQTINNVLLGNMPIKPEEAESG